jgi:hypothetical protein
LWSDPAVCSSACMNNVHQQKNISVRAEWQIPSGRDPPELVEAHWWRITPCTSSIPHMALHFSLQTRFHHFFLLCRFPILNKHNGLLANCDHKSEWVHRVHT